MLVACHFVHKERATHSTSGLHMTSNNSHHSCKQEYKPHEKMPGIVKNPPTSSPLVAPTGGFNGRCKYKSGRCMNERTLKDNGLPHTLCEEHRVLHNKNQRKSDTKRRRLRKGHLAPFDQLRHAPTSLSAPSMHLIHHHHLLEEYRSAGSTYSSDQEGSMHANDDDMSDPDDRSPRTPTMDSSHHTPPTISNSYQTSTNMEWSTEEIWMLHSILGIDHHLPPTSC